VCVLSLHSVMLWGVSFLNYLSAIADDVA
jgi:hypothetical protein